MSNRSARLAIDKAQWKLWLTDERGDVKFAEARPPEFRVGGQWDSLGRVHHAELSPAGDGVRLLVLRASGSRAVVDIRPFGTQGFTIAIACENDTPTAVRGATVLGPAEEVYGFGEMWNGHVAQRGQFIDLWDKAGTPDECAYMPYYVSTRNYAFFLNYGGKVSFDVGRRRADEIVYEAATPRLELTLVSGNSIASTVRTFVTETGLPARPPRWAFEPWFWLMSDPALPGGPIETLKGHHFIEMIDRLRYLDIPIGVTWFEPPWQTQRTSFKPNAEFDPDIPALIKRMADLGVRTLAWTVPYTTGTAENWREAVARGYLVRKPGAAGADGTVSISKSGELENRSYNYIDFYNPDAVAWWQKQIAAALNLGLKGFKLDAGQDLPPDTILHGGRRGRDVHNSYALEYNRVFGEELRRTLGDDFLAIPRASWIGASAFCNFKWPGDLSASFANNGLPSSVHSSLSLAFCGVPFVSTDIGGFDGRPAAEQVWVRWAQFGAMLPGMQTLHMPWWFSKKASDHYRYLAWLHTGLIPLWMSLANEAHATGAPIVRPLVWTFQDDMETWRVDDEFTVGQALLVAPILNPEPRRSVYLPEGRWFDFWDENTTVDGPRTVDWSKSPEESKWNFPLYIREGAIIPMEIVNDAIGFGSAESKGYLTLAIWPRGAGSSTFVLHDREAPVTIEVVRRGNGEMAISWGPTAQNYLLRVHLTGNAMSLEVRRDGASAALPKLDSLAAFRATNDAGSFFDAANKNLWIRQFNNGQPGSLAIVMR